MKRASLRGIAILITTFLMALSTSTAHAQRSPVGLWRTVDDVKPGKYKVLIRISEFEGVYTGRVEKVLDPDLVGKSCEKCGGELANKPFEGLQVMTGMRKDGDGYGGGYIVDPEGGGLYRCKMQPAADGRTMLVRGFLGISLFGRTQQWELAE